MVIDGRMEPELGVTYAPLALMPRKLETENYLGLGVAVGVGVGVG